MIQFQMPHSIATLLMFTGQAEEAMNFYVSLFTDSKISHVEKYGPDEPGREGTVKRADFVLSGHRMICIDSPAVHDFTFTAATSIYVDCEDESDLDQKSALLSDGGAVFMPPADYGFSRKFGWISDRYGVSWQLNLP